MRSFGWLFLAAAVCSLNAQNPVKCHAVGGVITTNFVDAADTLGSATGDLAGGLGVHVVEQQAGPNGTLLITVQHHWVTESGDTVGLDPATVTLFPTAVQGFYAASYVDGVSVNGMGTGRLAGASGKIEAWGAANFATGQLVLRYSGEVCQQR